MPGGEPRPAQAEHRQPQVREYIMQIGETGSPAASMAGGWTCRRKSARPVLGRSSRSSIRRSTATPGTPWADWNVATAFLQGDRFDGVMNYLFAEATLAFAGGRHVVHQMFEGRSYNPAQHMTRQSYRGTPDWLLGLHPWEVHLTQMNLLDSHDTARAVRCWAATWRGAALATLLLIGIVPGAPYIFAGDEIGLKAACPSTNAPHLPSGPARIVAQRRARLPPRADRPAPRPQTSAPRYVSRLVCDRDNVIVFARRFSGDVWWWR